MHELGIVFYIIKDVNEVVEQNGVTKVNSVTLNLGEVSTIVPEYLIDCWNWAVKRETALNGAELKVNRIQAITYCEDCKGEYPTVEFGKVCPHCGSEHTYLIRGQEVEIKEIEVQDDDETE